MNESDNNKPLVALGITGCIGAYKSAELLRRLQDNGIEVQPVMTASAQQFITPLTLSTLAQRATITGLWERGGDWDVRHISLSDECAALLVAPATANIIAKFAAGIADDFLSTLYLATDKPIIVAPAMNAKMWRHPATQNNVATLRERGVEIVAPGTGYLACGWEGEGRLADIFDIIDATLYAVHSGKTLAGKRFVVTAGPTAEDIDQMRFITNRSSGRMGIELAKAAKARGAEVVLIAGPVSARLPYGVEIVRVRNASEMHDAVVERLDGTDVLCKVAAVADYRPKKYIDAKIKKSDGPMNLELERTVDILADVGTRRQRPFLVGFAAESDDIEKYAREKLLSKNADMIVGNRIARAGSDENEGVILTRDGASVDIPRCSKARMAAIIADEIAERINS